MPDRLLVAHTTLQTLQLQAVLLFICLNLYNKLENMHTSNIFH